MKSDALQQQRAFFRCHFPPTLVFFVLVGLGAVLFMGCSDEGDSLITPDRLSCEAEVVSCTKEGALETLEPNCSVAPDQSLQARVALRISGGRHFLRMALMDASGDTVGTWNYFTGPDYTYSAGTEVEPGEYLFSLRPSPSTEDTDSTRGVLRFRIATSGS